MTTRTPPKPPATGETSVDQLLAHLQSYVPDKNHAKLKRMVLGEKGLKLCGEEATKALLERLRMLIFLQKKKLLHTQKDKILDREIERLRALRNRERNKIPGQLEPFREYSKVLPDPDMKMDEMKVTLQEAIESDYTRGKKEARMRRLSYYNPYRGSKENLLFNNFVRSAKMYLEKADISTHARRTLVVQLLEACEIKNSKGNYYQVRDIERIDKLHKRP